MLVHRLGKHSELRLLDLHHAEALFDLVDRNRQHLREWLPWVDGASEPAFIRNFIQGRLEALARGEGFNLTIWHNQQIAGTLGLFDISPGQKAEVGYWLGKEFEGHGLMTLSVRALLGYAFDELGLERVQIKAAVENLKSRAIPERLGFKLEGVLRKDGFLYGRYVDHVLYSLLAEEWR